MSDFLTLAKERYSGRNYSGRPVEKEKIEKILEAARVAPTACNYQPFRIWVIESEENLLNTKKLVPFRFCKQAPLLMVVGASKQEAWERRYDGKNFAEVDASIAATQMMLEIHDLGLRTTWVGAFNSPKLKEIFPEMADFELIAMFPVGYPAEDDEPNPAHNERLDMDEIVIRK